MSSSAREQFIEAGMHLYPRYGYRQLSVRLLAAETGLSSGMFHHLFASKDDFVSELLKQKYSEGFNQLVLNVLPEQGVQQNLRQVMVFIAFLSVTIWIGYTGFSPTAPKVWHAYSDL